GEQHAVESRIADDVMQFGTAREYRHQTAKMTPHVVKIFGDVIRQQFPVLVVVMPDTVKRGFELREVELVRRSFPFHEPTCGNAPSPAYGRPIQLASV